MIAVVGIARQARGEENNNKEDEKVNSIVVKCYYVVFAVIRKILKNFMGK